MQKAIREGAHWLRANWRDALVFAVTAVAVPVLLWYFGTWAEDAGSGVVAFLSVMAFGASTVGMPSYILFGLPLFWMIAVLSGPWSLSGQVGLLALAGCFANLGTFLVWIVPSLSHGIHAVGVAGLIMLFGFPAAALTGAVFGALHWLLDRTTAALLR